MLIPNLYWQHNTAETYFFSIQFSLIDGIKWLSYNVGSPEVSGHQLGESDGLATGKFLQIPALARRRKGTTSTRPRQLAPYY